MSTVESSRYGWSRLAAAIGFALLLLGLGLATSTGTAVAKKQGGKAGKRGGKAVTKTYVARSRTDGDALAVLRAKLSRAGVPLRVTMVRVAKVDGACTVTSPALISEPIETTYRYPRSLKVTAKKFRGASSAKGKATAISGRFVAGGVTISFTQKYSTPGPVIFDIPITLACDTTHVFTTARKPPRGKGRRPGGKGQRPGGKTRDRGSRTR